MYQVETKKEGVVTDSLFDPTTYSNVRKLAPLDISNRNFVLLLSIIYEAKMNDRIHLPKVVISVLLHNFPADIAAAACLAKT